MGALKRLDLAHQLILVDRAAGVPDLVTLVPVGLLADEGGDELVPAHADRPVDPPDRKHDPVLAEGAVPRERMLVVRVDQRAVDVEQSRLGGHYELVAPTGVFAKSSSSFSLNVGRSSGCGS